jgi:hypothetical protein
MVILTLQNSPQMRADLDKFFKILEAWDLEITDKSEDSERGALLLTINATYYSQANLVLAVANSTFRGSLIDHNAKYAPDPLPRN